jgi:hypothetical protein
MIMTIKFIREAHAVDTYAEFAESNKELLQSMEAPLVAKQYYEAADMYVFDEFQTSRARPSTDTDKGPLPLRRPVINSLYDVVVNIRDDEKEHVATMAACQDPSALVQSRNAEKAIVTATLATAIVALLFVTGNGGGNLGGGGGVLEGEASSVLSATQSAISSVLSDGGAAVSDSSDAVAVATAATTATASANPEAIEKIKDGGKVFIEEGFIILQKLANILSKIRI